jgi:hypothetical protein
MTVKMRAKIGDHQEKFMTENMLKMSQERVRLLKNGMQGKKIEEL